MVDGGLSEALDEGRMDDALDKGRPTEDALDNGLGKLFGVDSDRFIVMNFAGRVEDGSLPQARLSEYECAVYRPVQSLGPA